MTAADLTALLIDEATKKSGVVWVSTAAGTSPVWLVWHEGSAWLLSGPDEQPCEGLVDGGSATVTVRSKDKGSRLVTWDSTVSRVAPGTDEWAAVVPLLLGKRLNLIDGEAAALRWARDNVVHRLTPNGRITESPETMPDGSLAAAPLPSPATTVVPMPFTVGGSTRKLPRRSR